MAQNLNHYNERQLLKRSTQSGVIPTIPTGTTAVDVNDHTQGGWLDTDIYDGEFFMNNIDNKLWARFDDEIIELSSVSGYSYFTDLPDTPGSYSGQTGKLVAVNSSENALEFVDNTNITSITGLSDTPPTITNDKILVGSGSTYIEKDYINTFNQLIDVSGFTGNANKIYRINGSETNLDAVDGSDYFVDLIGNQDISGNKSFSGITSLNSVYFTNNFIMNSVDINNIIIDSGLTSASDNNIVTTKAIKDYIDNIIITAVGGDYVPRVGNSTILDIKTFSGNTEFISNINISGDTITNDIIQSISSYKYFGDINTDGSYRFFINPIGDLEIQKRESGTWVYKANF